MSYGFVEYAEELAIKAARKYNDYIVDYAVLAKQNREVYSQLQVLSKNIKANVDASFPLDGNDRQIIANNLRVNISRGDIKYSIRSGVESVPPFYQFKRSK